MYVCVVCLSALVSGCLEIGVSWVLFVVCCLLGAVLLVVLLLFVDCRVLCVDRFNCLRSVFVGCCVSLLVSCLMFVGLGFVWCYSLIVVCHVF